jgi:hypothetical protein
LSILASVLASLAGLPIGIRSSIAFRSSLS